MASAEVRLAKLSPPRVRNVLARERLFASIDKLRERPVVWIAAEPGAGKTTLLASYLDARRLPCIWYQVDGGDSDPASFFYHMGLAADSLKRRKAGAPPLPHLTPEHRADLPEFSRRYFRELYARMGRGSTLVFDNLHEAAAGTALHRVLAVAFEETPEGLGTLVASRGEPPPVYTPLIARERFAFVDAGDIRLTLEETRDIAHGRAELDAATVRSLHEHSGGWAAGLTLLIERARRGDPIDARHASGTLQPVFAYFAEELLAQDFHDDIDTLLQVAYLPSVTPEAAQALTGNAKAGALLEKLHRRHLFTQRRSVGAGTSYELHALLRAYLQHKAQTVWTEAHRRDVVARAARLLEDGGSPGEAVSLYRDVGDWASIARVVVANAQALIQQGRSQTLIEWAATLPESVKDAQPRVRYWLGSALAHGAPREARKEMVRAHAGFTRDGDALGRVLAACGIVYTYYLDLAELREMDPWIRELNAAVDAGVRFPTPAIELHLRAALLFGLCFRDPDRVRIRECADRMFLLLEDPGIGANEKVSAAALLLFHCYHHAHLEAGQRLVKVLEPLVTQAAPAVRGLWWIQVGYFSVTGGDAAAALRAFEESMRTCSEHALSIPLLDVYAQIGMGMTCVICGDYARAEAHRLRAEQHWKSFRLVDVASNAMLRGVLASHRGELDQAREFARQHYEVAEQAGIQWQAHNALLHCAFVAYESGRRADGAAFTAKARPMVAGTVFERFTYQADLLDGYGCLLAGDREGLRKWLAQGLASGRTDVAKFFLRLHPNVVPRLFAAALEEGIETDAVRRDIRRLRIPPPDANLEGWPWPLAIRTLGRFEVRREGQPLEFSRKAPRKTLALLKAIVAFGGTNVREQALLDALWPDEEGDAASKSLGATVLRLRTLLGDGESVVQQAGTLSLDRSCAWVDAWAFEQSARLDLYKGAFLAEDEGEPWAVPMRERLRARFIHQVGEEGARLEREGRQAEAIEWYLRGLDADSIVEPFYQGLMRCYERLDRRSEAIATYRRLRQILSVTLGLPPSATTERLYKSLNK